MFDIGFSELLVIAIVALVILGPERLPKAARFAGLWVRRARAQWYSVKAEFERDMAAEEMRRSLQDAKDAMRGIDDSVREADADIRREFDAVREAADAMEPGGDAGRAVASTAADADSDAVPEADARADAGDRAAAAATTDPEAPEQGDLLQPQDGPPLRQTQDDREDDRR
jgi:sec-independent protein translocase protein TatB